MNKILTLVILFLGEGISSEKVLEEKRVFDSRVPVEDVTMGVKGQMSQKVFNDYYKSWFGILEPVQEKIMAELRRINEEINGSESDAPRVFLIDGELKDSESLFRKMNSNYLAHCEEENGERLCYKDFKDISDFVRYSLIVSNTRDDVERVMESLTKSFGRAVVDKSSLEHPDQVGYSDRRLVFEYRVENSVDANDKEKKEYVLRFEILIELCSLELAKIIGHFFYQIQRVLTMIDEKDEETGELLYSSPTQLFLNTGDPQGDLMNDIFTLLQPLLSRINPKLNSFAVNFRTKIEDPKQTIQCDCLYHINDDYIKRNYRKAIEYLNFASKIIYTSFDQSNFENQAVCLNYFRKYHLATSSTAEAVSNRKSYQNIVLQQIIFAQVKKLEDKEHQRKTLFAFYTIVT
jgi:hypothetical protein